MTARLRSWLPVLALAAPLLAQDHSSALHPTPRLNPLNPARRPHADSPIAQRLLRDVPLAARAEVRFDQPGDGRIWASGESYKASFGPDGFVYVPFLGSDAPQDYPVQFVVRAARVGGHALAVAAQARASHADLRVTVDRGAVREIYDLTPTSVEQTFVVAGDLAGDVELEVEVVTELCDDPTLPGLQLGNRLGRVDYGTAYLVEGTTRREIPAELVGRTLLLRVAADHRGLGPVVIDPVITTKTFAPTLMASEVPDIAYDVSTDRWLVTWAHVFSATDHDVYAELRSGRGDPVAGSFRLIDNTTQSLSFPRCANLNSVDRFLIAMERIPQVVGNPYTVWGRTMDAGGAVGTSSLFEISPRSSTHQNSVDVGGDPGNGTRWAVVWVLGSAIYSILVDASGTVLNVFTPIHSSSVQCINPQISLSNGNGTTATPGWCVVFNRQASSSDWDVHAATLGLDGRLATSPIRIDNGGSANDLLPSVSSPFTDPLGRTAHLVSYHRVGSTTEMIAKVLDSVLRSIVPEVNLSQRHGYSGDFYRVESDGLRFAATCQTGTTLRVGTLALVNNDLIEQEPLQTVGQGGWPFIASKYSGGGGPTDYGIAYVDTGFAPFRVALGVYEGRASGGGISTRTTGCGLGLSTAGRPHLGEELRFALPDTGSDVAGFLLGVPMGAATVCGTCLLGVDPARPLLLLTAPLLLTLPRDATLVGAALSVQGFALGSGTCAGALRLSDTADFTIR